MLKSPQTSISKLGSEIFLIIVSNWVINKEKLPDGDL
jgi:hypothetical protein